MFSQKRFNALCDQIVLATVELYSVDDGEDAVSIEFAAAAEKLEEASDALQFEIEKLGNTEMTASVINGTEMLVYLGLAMGELLDKQEAKMGYNPLVAWLSTYLLRTIDYWRSQGKTSALVDAAQNAQELNDEDLQ